MSINGPMPADRRAGFPEIQEWDFEEKAHPRVAHPVIHAWYEKHFADKGWAPTSLLACLTEKKILKRLKVGEAIISLAKLTEIWLSENRDQGCSIIGKFTQGSKAGGRGLTRRLLTNQGKLDFLVRDTRKSGCWLEHH